jgi:hypothetical protein
MNTEEKPCVFFFGCRRMRDGRGHTLYDEEGYPARGGTGPWRLAGIQPFTAKELDGGLQPKGSQELGSATRTWKDDWTAVAFWDRSADTRPNSCGVFLVEGLLGFADAMHVFAMRMPKLFERINGAEMRLVAE